MRIRGASADEAPALSDLAMRSKAHWGYDADFMERCREELAVDPARCRAGDVFVVEEAGATRGFYSLEALGRDRIELGHLFVEPEHIGTGMGRALLAHAIGEARRRGARVLVIQGDPNATAFYEAGGGVRVGTRPSQSIAGRSLPLFEIELDGMR